MGQRLQHDAFSQPAACCAVLRVAKPWHSGQNEQVFHGFQFGQPRVESAEVRRAVLPLWDRAVEE